MLAIQLLIHRALADAAYKIIGLTHASTLEHLMSHFKPHFTLWYHFSTLAAPD